KTRNYETNPIFRAKTMTGSLRRALEFALHARHCEPLRRGLRSETIQKGRTADGLLRRSAPRNDGGAEQ
ncbi:MAG TPA: hypothetical protein VNF99_02035, partial [Stellaceae bacterium]|nr:hypothetical protein [Stellaceae bacterium]